MKADEQSRWEDVLQDCSKEEPNRDMSQTIDKLVLYEERAMSTSSHVWP
jgi:hypothetical protein